MEYTPNNKIRLAVAYTMPKGPVIKLAGVWYQQKCAPWDIRVVAFTSTTSLLS